LRDWLKKKVPSKDALLANRWLRPFAHYLGDPNIWHFNRHSIARGVALGLFFGIVIPIAQTPVAALFAVSARANLAVAAFCTFITNPFTTPLIYIGAYETGLRLLSMQERASLLSGSVMDDGVKALIARLLDAPLPTAVGLLLISTLSSVIGYWLVHLLWRANIRRRWASRRRHRVAHG
jgi:uncharacterized protein